MSQSYYNPIAISRPPREKFHHIPQKEAKMEVNGRLISQPRAITHEKPVLQGHLAYHRKHHWGSLIFGLITVIIFGIAVVISLA